MYSIPRSSPQPAGALPRHVGIIMDGNGRWAVRKGKDRSYGHKKGLENARTILAHCAELGIPYLSLFVFSTENWKRAQEETGFLMDLLYKNLRKEYDFYKEMGIRLVHSGDRKGLPGQVQKELEAAMADTRNFDHLVLNLAINYGSRDEIVRACQAFCDAKERDGPQFCPDFDSYLDTPDLPDIDLLIRTGGEMRLSNFMLWKSAYAELYFSDTLWPDWGKDELNLAISEYQHRQRRFGGTP